MGRKQERAKSSQARRAIRTALLVFDDPYALTQRDISADGEERWVAVGAVGPGSILLVVHTFY